jgi:glycosyltransferase involved in cell wall biosynthesis
MRESFVRVTCLVKRYDHHTASGGYDRLAGAVGAQVIMRKQIPGLFGKAANGIWRQLTPNKGYAPVYDVGDWLTELQALTTGFFWPPDVLHVLYDSQLYLLAKRRKLLRCPLIVTVHGAFADPSYTRPLDAFPKGLGIDVAVVVATSQIAPLQRLIGPRKIVYIPHGIDTDRFRPKDYTLSPGKLRVLIVGHNMRDWFVIHRTIDEINRQGLDVEFHVVTAEHLFPFLTGCDNLVLHSQISEAELVDLYCSADVLFLPVFNATANNSVLEALACGTPVISTLVGGIPDYVNEASGWLLPLGDVHAHVNLIASLASNRELARNRRKAARTQALKFDWRCVAEQMIALYTATKSRASAQMPIATPP